MKPYKKNRFHLHPKGEDFTLDVAETDGFYQLLKDENSDRWFLAEMDGKVVMLSEFEVSAENKPLWLTMIVLPSEDLVNLETHMIPMASDLVERYFG